MATEERPTAAERVEEYWREQERAQGQFEQPVVNALAYHREWCRRPWED